VFAKHAGGRPTSPGSSARSSASELLEELQAKLPEKSLDALTRIRFNGKHLLDLINTDWSALWVCFRAAVLTGSTSPVPASTY
jgi:hypothetical protein